MILGCFRGLCSHHFWFPFLFAVRGKYFTVGKACMLHIKGRRASPIPGPWDSQGPGANAHQTCNRGSVVEWCRWDRARGGLLTAAPGSPGPILLEIPPICFGKVQSPQGIPPGDLGRVPRRGYPGVSPSPGYPLPREVCGSFALGQTSPSVGSLRATK